MAQPVKGRLLDPARQKRVALEKSKRQETRTAMHMGGRRVPGSGNKWHSKGDVSTKSLHIENKRTDASSYVLKLTELKKGRLQAGSVGKRFVMQVDFGDDHRNRFVVIPLSEFEGLEDDNQD